MTFPTEQTTKIAEDAATSLIAKHGIDREDGETAIQALAWSLGDGPLTYEAGLAALVHEAVQIVIAQQTATLQNDERDLEVGVWSAHPDMAADGGPEAIVVQIDTGDATGRLRVNINDAAVWDGDPRTDQQPGAWFQTEPLAAEAQSLIVNGTDFLTLVDASEKWSTELHDYIIPAAAESDTDDANSYRAQAQTIDETLVRARKILEAAAQIGGETSAEDERTR
jgi:hypothetical protein